MRAEVIYQIKFLEVIRFIGAKPSKRVSSLLPILKWFDIFWTMQIYDIYFVEGLL